MSNLTNKIHTHLLKGIASALFAVFSEGKYADKEIPSLLKKNPKWGAKDRRFVATHSYDIIRWWRLYHYALDRHPEYTEDKLTELIAVSLIHKEEKIGEISLFNHLNEVTLSNRLKEAKNKLEIAQSIPDWLNQFGKEQLGEFWEREITALNDNAIVFIRKKNNVNLDDLLASFKKENIQIAPYQDNTACYQIIGKAQLEKSKAWENGWFEIQDAGSQLIAPYLSPKAHEFIIDACAGAGGKCLHLADLSNDKAKILALDVHQNKLERLKIRAKKAGYQSIDTAIVDEQILATYKGKADRILLDVPCSGSGVFKRQVDGKWKLNKEKIDEVIETQKNILTKYPKMLKPGGFLLYATCSIFPAENELQIGGFLKQNSHYELIKQHTQFPSTGTDGFYMALLRKNQ